MFSVWASVIFALFGNAAASIYAHKNYLIKCNLKSVYNLHTRTYYIRKRGPQIRN